MKSLLIFRVMPFMLLSGVSTADASPPYFPNLADLVEKAMPGVVNVSSTTITNVNMMGMDQFYRMWGIPQERKQTSLGSGFIFNEQEGLVMTNHHVIAQADEVMVTLTKKREYRAKIIGTDSKLDLAILKLQTPEHVIPQGLEGVPLGDSDKTRIGDPLFAVGNPFGLQHTVTSGIISAKNRTIGIGPLDNYLQTDASINQGNSGGPLFNLKGEVIGINTAIFSKTGQSAGIGFAIPINEVKKVLPDLLRYGRVPRPWLGILGERITSQMQTYYGLPVSKGVVVYNLVRRGPADRSGLQRGDIITEIESVPVTELHEIERVLFNKRPKDTITLSVYRGRKELKLKIKLDELPEQVEEYPQEII